MISRRMTAVMALVGLTLAACGGSDDTTERTDPPATAATAATTSTTEPAPATTTTAPTTSTTEPAPATTTTAPATSTTEPAPTTTVAPAVTEFDLAALPDLLTELEAGGGGDDPVATASRLGGFPLEIPVPDGSSLTRFDTVIRTDGGVRTHEFLYAAVAPGGTVPDIDISLDGNGPGSAQIIEIWDPIMAELGFERANSTGSDPGDPGGPNSVNHVYVPTASAPTFVNGLPATPGNVFVWSSEDITGAASGLDPTDPVGGYRIDADADVDSSLPVAVPLLTAITDHLPLPDGVELSHATLRLESRSPDAFEIDRGARYLSISVEWTATPGSTVDELAAFYGEPSPFTDDVLIPAEASFFDEGFYEPTEIGEYGDTDRRLPLLLLRRYEGILAIEAPSDPADPITIAFDVTINPNDAELSAPAG